MTTLMTVTRIAVPASERNSVPGIAQRITTIASSRVEPAKAVVRPAVARVRPAASSGELPEESSSRKRETMSSA